MAKQWTVELSVKLSQKASEGKDFIDFWLYINDIAYLVNKNSSGAGTGDGIRDIAWTVASKKEADSLKKDLLSAFKAEGIKVRVSVWFS